MYRAEVPQYGQLLDLVAEVNAAARSKDPELDRRLVDNGEVERLDLERHGAVRLGTGAELATLRRVFAVMGMAPVGYYDLSVAGVPVHSTAFRPVADEALRRNPFRVFTSLLRLDLLADPDLAAQARAILARRSIFTPGCLSLLEIADEQGGLTPDQAVQFVEEALETFRWHSRATVSIEVYQRLRAAHPLVADVVCFKGPHINHLTPRTLDIDAAQLKMTARGLSPKAVIEGPPRRRAPILLRQTSFKALEEPVALTAPDGMTQAGAHTARFGEIEQRGAALTPKGRALYDALLSRARAEGAAGGYAEGLAARFEAFPDDEAELRRQGLAYCRYRLAGGRPSQVSQDLETLISHGHVTAEPIVYEDFLPVSAAGIFQSNLGGEGLESYAEKANQAAFEQALGAEVIDPDDLYRQAESASKAAVLQALRET